MDEEDDSKLMPYVVYAGIIIIPTATVLGFFDIGSFDVILGVIVGFYMGGIVCSLFWMFLSSIKFVRDFWPFGDSADTLIILGYTTMLILFIIGLSR